MKAEEPPKWPPYSIYVATYQSDFERRPESKSIIDKLFHEYGGVHSKDFDRLDFRSGSILCYVRGRLEGKSQVFIIAVGPIEAEKESLNSIPSYDEYDELVESLKEALPGEPEFACTLRVAYATDEKEAVTLLHRYLNNLGRSLGSAGLVRGCLLATLKNPEGSPMPMPSRELIVLPYRREFETGMDVVWTLSFEVCYFALYMGEMRRLYSDRKLMFSQMDASERSTQLRINKILAEMRRPVDEIQPVNLEDILKDITIQFSDLSTLTSSMRRDYIKAQGLQRKLRNLLKGWNERPVGESLRNSTVEIENSKNLMVPFRDFIERIEALMVQLNTVLDSVRTYMGIQQQKLSITEQTSSKEQLVRLVNLQEILHKMEVLIVAVYLTEMAKIIFEAVAHESANLLTALFIPIALIISIIIGRLLHAKKPH